MKRIGGETHLSTLESVVVIASFIGAVAALFIAFTWATKP